ncbi:MAG: hypothetical protein HY692_03715 [Cyanobacteria bacterium NC_groundwater_1444_Ag_S-0.65um_54_12]|nr:hypothetical protein [Cyanobacteria bacterium NC_groundwater_1444_Ag_S-0.65um_54_12]
MSNRVTAHQETIFERARRPRAAAYCWVREARGRGRKPESEPGEQIRSRKQRGQALVYLTMVLVVLATALYATYDLGRLTLARMQAQNAADSAALAAVSVKASVHHTRTLAYAAMTGEANLARLKLAAALAVLGEQPPVPGQPYLAKPQFDRYMREAEAHLAKLRRLRAGLIAYNRWIAKEGPTIVAAAARVAYAANVAELNDASGKGQSGNLQNLHLLDSSKNLLENGASFKAGQFIGGINYVSEGAGETGAAGKTFVWVEPVFVPLGTNLLGAQGSPLILPAYAAAGPVHSREIGRDLPQAGDLSFAGFGMRWYSARLFQIGGIHGFPHKLLH